MAQSLVRSPSLPSRKRTSRVDYDSPSKQLLRDLERTLDNIQIHEAEELKAHAYERRSWYGQLDHWDQERAKQDFAALDAATARHEAIRSEAEKELERYYKRVEDEERKRREEEERILKEKRARKKAAKEQREREEAARKAAELKAKEEAERKAAEAKAKADAAEKARKEREETEARELAENARKDKEDAERKTAAEKAKHEEHARICQMQTQQAPAAVSATTMSSSARTNPGVEARHQRYLEIHQRLKEFRRNFWEECKKNKDIKTKVGDLRRSIKTSVGQLVEPTPESKGANAKPTLTIRTAMQQATQLQAPPVNLNDFLLNPVDSSAGPPQAPSVLIYALNIFSKAIITQFSNESGVNTKAAEPAGILVASVFSQPEMQYGGRPLIDILLAKMHKVCPVLFGIYGPEKTAEGKQRLGWRKEDGAFVSDNRHGERMTGLGAGFAAIALRNFSKSTHKNPYPPANYWEAFATILNTPANHVQPSHLLVLKGMIENGSERFITFFNSAGLVALRRALRDLPASLPANLQKSPACSALALLSETLKRDKQIELF